MISITRLSQHTQTLELHVQNKFCSSLNRNKIALELPTLTTTTWTFHLKNHLQLYIYYINYIMLKKYFVIVQGDV